MQPESTPKLEELLKDAHWIQRVAYAMAGDAASAEDLAQDAWMVALRRSAKSKGTEISRPWMIGVLRNLMRTRLRKERLRTSLEPTSSGSEVRSETLQVASAEQLVLRAEAQQRVARAVLKLEEPLRSTMLLRYFEGHTPEAIAKLQGVRPDTVRGRLRRATAQLKQSLVGSEEDEWSKLCGLLLPLRAAELSTVGVVMGMKAKLVAAALMVSAVSGWLVLREESDAEPSVSMAAQEMEDVSTPQAGLPDQEAGSPTQSSMRESVPNPIGQGVRVHGRVAVLLPSGEVESEPSGHFTLIGKSEITVAVQGGSWEFEARPGDAIEIGQFTMVSPGPTRRAMRSTLWAGTAPSDGRAEWSVALEEVAVEAIATIHVVDKSSGSQVPSAQLLVWIPSGPVVPLMDNEERRERTWLAAETPLLVPLREPELTERKVWVGAEGYTWSQLQLPKAIDSESWVELRPAGELEIVLEGDGAPPGSSLDLTRLDGPKGIVLDMGDDWYGRPEPGPRMLMTGVPVGEYRVDFRFDPGRTEWPFKRELGSAKGRVQQAERTTVHLACDQVLATPPVELDLTVVVPRAWKLDSYYLQVHPIQAGSTHESLRWTEEDLPLGTNGQANLQVQGLTEGLYLFEFFSLGQMFHVGLIELQDAQSRVEFRVPEPVKVQLWVTDRTSGAPQEIAGITLRSPEMKGVSDRATVFKLPPKSSNGAVVFQAPATEQGLKVTLADGRSVQRTISPSGQQQDFVLEVE